MTDLSQLQSESLAATAAAFSVAAIEEVRVAYLGKKGKITELMKTLGSLSVEEKKSFGAAVNQLKNEVTAAIDARKEVLGAAAINERLTSEWIDITKPIRPESRGKIHPITQVIEEITTIFAALGFSVAEGPEIESDYYNFEALNFPSHHPARDMHDTFFLKGDGKEKTLLRTHTSPVQIRTMRAGKPPFRFIAPGKTFRCDSDMTHTPMFHQIEGFVIDKGIHMGHLKGTIEHLIKSFFEVDDVPVRFRPSFFPFTEPSAEVDIGCSRANGELKIGAGKDWLEVMGCGMVHANVLKNCGLDPNEWQGFAFGLGVERFAMLKYGIPDLRTFFESDVRWLEHYGFDALDIPSIVRGLAR
jgi:phenylalanyl-tRNA synthetase alpha chain